MRNLSPKKRLNSRFYILLIVVVLIGYYTINNFLLNDSTQDNAISESGELNENIQKDSRDEFSNEMKLHWFIPDGMRNDPELINVFKWAEEGKLPNIKKLMDMGSYGFSIPTFPSHTPTNFASLLTGTYPEVHGVADGPMHIEGYPLTSPSVGGFRSAARKVPAIWSLLEESGKKVALLSMPGSTPPELDDGITIRGRWGGWGADFHSLIFESKELDQRKKLGRGSRLFFFGYELTRFIEPVDESWSLETESFSDIINLKLEGHGAIVYARVLDTTDDEIENYDVVEFSRDMENIDARLKQGEWSEWLPITFKWSENDVSSNLKLHVIKLDDDGFFRIRYLVDNINEYVVEPSTVSQKIRDEVGPMVDFVDNFPPQLIYYEEDKETFLAEAKMSFDWHEEAVGALYELYEPDVVIHDIYTPNQMLTGRWWLGYIDPVSSRYNEVSEEEREQLWKEVEDMYKRLDDIVGEAMKYMDENTVFVLSSDHGATPLDKWVRLNNLFVEKGWLVVDFNEETGEPIIDWDNTKVIYLKMDNVYINPKGIGENWTRASGEEYESLREEVTQALYELEDDNGKKPVEAVVNWEDVEQFLDLPTDRVGDLVIANVPGYGWNEEMTEDGILFDVPLKTGYKQAIFSNETKQMWTPFIIVGPGVKKNYEISEPIEMVDQFPTIMTVLGEDIPDYVQGKVLEEVLVN
jgi:predicted AlkP superfamily phosphohydrolase/phosphomutase